MGNMGNIEAALAALESLEVGESINCTKFAKEYGVKRTTLSRRDRGVTRSGAERDENNNELCYRGLPPTKEMIRNFASEIARKPIGKNWDDRFVERHKDKLKFNGHLELIPHVKKPTQPSSIHCISSF